MNDELCNCEHPLRPQPRHAAYSPPATSSSEIAELMAVKSKHGAGGEYSPDWKPKVRTTLACSCSVHLTSRTLPTSRIQQEQPAPAPPPAAEEPAPPAPAKPAWRTVQRKPLAHKKEAKSAPAATPAPAPEPSKPAPSWSTWKRASPSSFARVRGAVCQLC
jgi:hypothetical protein